MRYHQDKMDNDNYEFDHDINDFEVLDTGVCIDRDESKEKGYDISYVAWATDLLPHEFNEDWVNIEREKVYYFIGIKVLPMHQILHKIIVSTLL